MLVCLVKKSMTDTKQVREMICEQDGHTAYALIFSQKGTESFFHEKRHR
jgi:hypothetical protein